MPTLIAPSIGGGRKTIGTLSCANAQGSSSLIASFSASTATGSTVPNNLGTVELAAAASAPAGTQTLLIQFTDVAGNVGWLTQIAELWPSVENPPHVTTLTHHYYFGGPATNPAVNAQYWPLTLTGANASHVIVPTAVNVSASGAYVYVTAYDSSVTPSAGYVFGFSVGSGGALTAVPGSPFAAGIQPSAIASDAKSAFVYVTDSVRGNVLGYSVSATTGTAGALTALSGSPYPAGNDPTGVVVDPSYAYAYVSNSTDATVTAYSMSSTGVLTRINSYATGLQPVAIGIDPSTNHFLFTVNFLDNTVSDFELSTTAGTLLDAQFSPFPTNAQPVAAAAIPHNGTGGGVGSH